jgi:Fur family transcriptional regulator, stress-responsive regulator
LLFCQAVPEISRATVYNTLSQFRELGEVLKITLDAGPKPYDPNSEQGHQHLVCGHGAAFIHSARPVAGRNSPAPIGELPPSRRRGENGNRRQGRVGERGQI